MAFRFSLQTVLRLRISYENVERLKLLGFSALIVRIREEIAAVDRTSAEARRKMQSVLSSGLSGSDLHLELVCERARAEARRGLEARVAELTRRYEKQRAVYLLARQKREILENLRERRLTEYRKEQARREQQQLTDLFLLRRTEKAQE